jgi:hypothetical protein
MRIFLDDIRDPPKFDAVTGEPIKWDYVCRNAIQAIALIESGGVEFISFDHDLGTELTGYDVACHIEASAIARGIKPPDYAIHSANPVGANRIDQAMKSAWRKWEER